MSFGSLSMYILLYYILIGFQNISYGIFVLPKYILIQNIQFASKDKTRRNFLSIHNF